MQLLADEGHEGGNITPGLGWISGKVRHFSDCLTDPESRKLKIPHMGWNSLSITRDSHPVCASLPRNVQMYFVHSYVFDDAAEDQLLAVAHYGMAVPALIGRDNIIGTQFHPEKSQQAGQAMLDSFLSWRP
jgi:glutamine amidotransferase